MPTPRRKVCFVTGTRAEFGLMKTALHAIAAHRSLQLQLVVTGMHLDPAHGRSIQTIRAEGWNIDATVPWRPASSRTETAHSTGTAIAAMAKTFDRLKTDVVLVVGDRVEAFAAAAAGHVGGQVVAHVHGGDRALGQIDDSLRHAITKLAHLHFPATAESAARIRKLGEDAWRIRRVGSPGLDGIRLAAAPFSEVHRTFDGLAPRQYALLILHPATTDETVERKAAGLVLRSVLASGAPRVVIVHPNNDPGARGIAACWDKAGNDARLIIRRDVPRGMFLGLMRDAGMLVGNSSSGIIEAASFGTPVLDIGSRQAGRERSGNVVHVPLDEKRIRSAVASIWRKGQPMRWRGRNVYGGNGTGKKIAAALAELSVGAAKPLQKLIAY